MRAPRMRVAVFGTSANGRRLAEGMAAAGHFVDPVGDLHGLRDYSALIIAVPDSRLAAAIDAVEPFVRDGLIVFHTCLSRGVQILDPLEVRGCVVAAVAPCGTNRWAVTATDELSDTIAGLVVGEMQAGMVPLADSERPATAARVAYAVMTAAVARAAAADAGVRGEQESQPPVDPFLGAGVEDAEIFAAYSAIYDPGLRRAYIDVARRVGEIEGREELEMWALQEENR